MMKVNGRWFYIARHRQGGKICYVISAHTIQKAIDSFGDTAIHYEFKQLRYSDMSKLLGCNIPLSTSAACLAKGDILLQVKGGHVAIRVAD